MPISEFTYLQPYIYSPFKQIVRSRTPYVQKRTDMILHHQTK